MANMGRIWLLLGGVVAVLIIALGWFVVATPLFNQAASADSQRADVEATNQQLETTLAGMKALDEDKDALIAELTALQTSVPSVVDAESYFDWIALAAGLSAVSVTTATAGEVTPLVVADGAAVTFSPGLTERAYIVPVTIEVGGNAEQLNTFLNLLQTDGRLQLINKVGLNLGTSLTGSISGYIFVVHDPALGAIQVTATPADGTATDEGAGTEGDAEPAPSATPTPPAETPGTEG